MMKRLITAFVIAATCATGGAAFAQTSTSKPATPKTEQTTTKEAKGKTEPIHLILQSDTFVTLADIDYHDGERYPTLVRVEGTPAYLDDITKPLTTPAKSE